MGGRAFSEWSRACLHRRCLPVELLHELSDQQVQALPQPDKREPRTWNLWPLEPFAGSGLGLGRVMWLQWACLVAKTLASWRMNVTTFCLQRLVTQQQQRQRNSPPPPAMASRSD